MPQIILTKSKYPKLDGKVQQKSFAFLQKLAQSDELAGLHIEPMHGAADPRARTGRVDQGLRAVLYRIDAPGEDTIYVYDGTFEHDVAIARAKTRVLRVNPVNHIPEIIERTMPEGETGAAPAGTSCGTDAGRGDGHGETAADRPSSDAPTGDAEPFAGPLDDERDGASHHVPGARPEGQPSEAGASTPTRITPVRPFLSAKGYTLDDLTGRLGFDDATARLLCSFRTEAALLDHVDDFENEWQINAVLGLADGTPVERILETIGAARVSAGEIDAGDNGARAESAKVLDRAEREGTTSEDDAELSRRLREPAARAQFTFVEDDDELRRVIDGGDFGQWRVFLHPEQRRYADADYSGAFRLTGGAGTGKTVVLLHRARRLARERPDARIVLTTFNRALASDLDRNLQRLDPTIRRATELGQPGVLVIGIDQLAAAVRKQDQAAFGRAAAEIFGAPIDARTVDPNEHWGDAIDDVGELPASLRSPSFFAGEYLHVVLPQRIHSRDAYLRARRPGRGVALDRGRRASAWSVFERFRTAARHENTLTFGEIAAIAAVALEQRGERLADHVLADEAQDFHAPHWQLLRALVDDGPNDLFIAEDAHQRIYGQRVALKQYGIRLQGRARRLTLNYRTTQQNLRFALGVLEGGAYSADDDLELEGATTYRSARTGPRPRTLAAASTEHELDLIADAVRGWLDEGIAPETIAILVRTKPIGTRLQRALEARDVSVRVDARPSDRTGVPTIITMHQAKGLEFSRVLLPHLAADSMPAVYMLKDVPAEELETERLKERSLLYVAASRARDELVVTWAGAPTEFLGGDTAGPHEIGDEGRA